MDRRPLATLLLLLSCVNDPEARREAPKAHPLSPAERAEAESLLELLGSADEAEVAIEARSEIVSMGAPVVPLLARALASADGVQQRRLIQSLRMIDTPTAAEVLLAEIGRRWPSDDYYTMQALVSGLGDISSLPTLSKSNFELIREIFDSGGIIGSFAAIVLVRAPRAEGLPNPVPWVFERAKNSFAQESSSDALEYRERVVLMTALTSVDDCLATLDARFPEPAEGTVQHDWWTMTRARCGDASVEEDLLEIWDRKPVSMRRDCEILEALWFIDRETAIAKAQSVTSERYGREPGPHGVRSMCIRQIRHGAGPPEAQR